MHVGLSVGMRTDEKDTPAVETHYLAPDHAAYSRKYW